MPPLRRFCWAALVSSASLISACSGGSEPVGKGKATHTTKAPAHTQLTIVGTNDLHGHIEMLPLLGGYLKILRKHTGNSLVLVDGGDMFQGTLASNLREGAPIVEAYNRLGYHAATIGNHEFDFGPEGEDATVQRPGQDPRGALKARAAAARFPFLGANVLDTESQGPIAWNNVVPTTLVEVSGISVGIIGVTTFETPYVTLAANFVGLHMAPLAETISARASELRKKGAQVIIVAAHSGGDCSDFSDHSDISSCAPHHEIVQVANELAPAAVDVIVAGHTHRAMAHEINGIAIIESYSRGKAFGRVDLDVAPDGAVSLVKIHPPRFLCADEKATTADCETETYEGTVVTPDVSIEDLAKTAADFAESVRSRKIGIAFASPVLRSRADASALGNLFAELMLDAHPEADVAITNGGSLRADLPSGPLRYGDLFEAMPFDNRFAMVRLRGKTLRKLFESNLQKDSGILSVAGMRVKARCKGKVLQLTMTRSSGKVITDDDLLLLSTSDFIASGGDGLLGTEGMELDKVEIDGGLLIRDAMAKLLQENAAKYLSALPGLYDPKKPRIQFQGSRPISCQ